MTPTQEALARRAVACPGWRWMPGMSWVRIVPGAQALSAQQGRLGDDPAEWPALDGLLPVLGDPASLGCLLALVEAALGEPHLWVEYDNIQRQWEIVRDDAQPGEYWYNDRGEGLLDTGKWGLDGRGNFVVGDDKAAALVAALEAAGRR